MRLLDDIIDNFSRQLEFYQEMAVLSDEQLALLERNSSEAGSDDLHDLLFKRQKLMERITDLNRQNKELQQAVINELEIDEFVLSRLKGQIEDSEYLQLEKIIKDLGLILVAINENDRRNQSIMKQSLVSQGKVRQVNHTEAQNQYKNAMQQSKKQL